MIGQTLSHYRIIKELGKGGMGIVYLAEDILLGRQVAIKMLKDAGGPGREHYHIRFLREARSACKLSHPHIATIHDFGETPDGRPFIVMEYVKGKTLSDLIQDHPLTLPRSLQIVIDVAEALSEAHRNGIVHRDIKPSNIAINEQGVVKVLDFGLAKHFNGLPDEYNDPRVQAMLDTRTREGVIVCTPEYSSPEQALGLSVDARSDLFSLGSVLYECITGKRAFSGLTEADTRAQVIRNDPPPPSIHNSEISKELDRIALKALAKTTEQRYQSAEELITDLLATSMSIGNNYSTSDPVTGAREAVATSLFLDPETRGSSRILAILTRARSSIGSVAVIFSIVLLTFLGVWYASRPTAHQPTVEAQEFYDRGVAALRDGSYFTASNHLLRAIDADKQFVLPHARLAEAWAELDYTDRATGELLKINYIDRAAMARADRLYLDAITATVQRDFPSAITSYTKLLTLKPNDAASYFDLARAYENNEQIDQAIENFRRATELKKDAAAAYLRLGVLYSRKRDQVMANAAFDNAEELYRETTNFEGHAEVLFQRGVLLKQRGELKQSRDLLQRALEIARIAESQSQQVRSKLQLSSISYLEGHTDDAKQQATEALRMARDNNMENRATEGLLDLGYAFFVSRKYVEAEEYFRQALDIAQRNGSRRQEARARLSFGALYIQQEQPEMGQSYLEQALEFYRIGGYRKDVSQCLIWSGRLQLLKGDYEGAVKILDEQLQLARQVDDPAQLARTQEELAPVLSKQALYPQALKRYTESYQTYKLLNNSFHVAFCLINRADMLAQLGYLDEARAALEELSPYVDRLPADNNYREIWTAWAYLIRARMALSQHDFHDTIDKCNEALAVLTAKNNISIASTKAVLGLAQVRSRMIDRGKKTTNDAVSLAIATRDARTIAETRLALAEALLARGAAKQALAVALLAQEGLGTLHLREAEWRAWLIAARSSRKLNDVQSAGEQLSEARNGLLRLRASWGEDAFRTYLARDDIKMAEQQLNEIAAP